MVNYEQVITRSHNFRASPGNPCGGLQPSGGILGPFDSPAFFFTNHILFIHHSYVTSYALLNRHIFVTRHAILTCHAFVTSFHWGNTEVLQVL